MAEPAEAATLNAPASNVIVAMGDSLEPPTSRTSILAALPPPSWSLLHRKWPVDDSQFNFFVEREQSPSKKAVP